MAYESSTFSLVLAWICALPLALGCLAWLFTAPFTSDKPLPRGLNAWMMLCVVALTPIRYMLFQVVLASAFPWQSGRAFISSIATTFYVPIVFGILAAIGIGVPMVIVALIAGDPDQPSKMRIACAAIAAPVACLASGWLYYLVLPLGAWTTHWLRAEDVVRAGNGPARYCFTYVTEQLTPIEYPQFAHDIGLERMTPQERMRAHLVTMYCSDSEYSRYVHAVYPNRSSR